MNEKQKDLVQPNLYVHSIPVLRNGLLISPFMTRKANRASIVLFLSSESSFFISPHRLILKTCGTTLNLYGLPRILHIAATQASLPTVHRCFYSRKSYFFPERQKGIHRDWKNEVEYLDDIFKARDDHCVKHTDSLGHGHGDGATGKGVGGAAYTVGKVNGDHWLLYIMGPDDDEFQSQWPSPAISIRDLRELEDGDANGDSSPVNGNSQAHILHRPPQNTDYTIEILMTHLSRRAAREFEFDDPPDKVEGSEDEESPSERAQKLSHKIGITHLFPKDATTLDAYAFSPCGYSANALLRWGDDSPAVNGHVNGDRSLHVGESGEGYYTIHVTPEDGWSYASFECNVPLAPEPCAHATEEERASARSNIPDIRTLVRRVVDIFEPGKLSLTLFISSDADEDSEGGQSAVERAQKAFRAALTAPVGKRGGAASPVEGDTRGGKVYKRTDKINYEFGGYDLAFASFELVG